MVQKHAHLTNIIPLDAEQGRKEDGSYEMAWEDPLLGIQRYLENGFACMH